MMAQAAPLLLLLLWLLMNGFTRTSGPTGIYKEGQTLRLSCIYSPQRVEDRWKTWCKVRDDERLCDEIITRKPNFIEKVRDLRASLEDLTHFGIITITISNLLVEDSGNYWCGIYDSVYNGIHVISTIRLEFSPVTTSQIPKCSRATTEIPLTTPATLLINSSLPYSSIFFRSPVIQVLCGLIVAKGLVFTALVVLLGRCRGPGKGRRQSELPQDQNDLK